MLWKKRPLAQMAGVLLATSLLAACGGGADADDVAAEVTTPADPVSLRMTVWTANEAHLALFNEIADEYIAENPDLVSEVKFDALPFDDYMTTLTTQLAGGNAPDLAWIFEHSAPEFVESGALADISGVLSEAEGYEYDDLMDSALELWKKDDGLYAYPFSNSPFVMFVNTDRIAESGQPNPAELYADGEWTLDKAREIAAASAEQLGGQGFVVRDFDYANWSNLETVLFQFGAEPWSADGTECTFNSPEMVDGMTWLHDAAFQDGAMPTPGTSADFFAGDVTMTITQISRASSADGSFEFDVVPLPEGPDGQVGVVGQAGLGVMKNSANPAVAADFLAFFTKPDNAKKLAAFFPPPRESLISPEVLKEANKTLTDPQLEAVVDGIVGARAKAAHKNYAQLDTAIRAELDSLWTEGADVEGVLNQVCTAIEPLLNS